MGTECPVCGYGMVQLRILCGETNYRYLALGTTPIGGPSTIKRKKRHSIERTEEAYTAERKRD